MVVPMSTSKNDIFNLSIFQIGHTKTIFDPDENSPEAAHCRKIYDQHRRAILSMAKWSFAKTVTPLALTANTPNGWSYEYQYPSGCLKALEIAKTNPYDAPIPFQAGSTYDSVNNVNNRVIWTNWEGASLVHIRDLEDTTKFTPMFVQTLANRMSSDLARVLAKKDTLAGQMFQMYQLSFNDAVRMGEVEAEDVPQNDAAWILDR